MVTQTGKVCNASQAARGVLVATAKPDGVAEQLFPACPLGGMVTATYLRNRLAGMINYLSAAVPWYLTRFHPM